MQDDFDDGGIGLPDDAGGGSELPDIDAGEGDVEIDLDSAMEPGRPSGGARAVSRKSAGGGKPAATKSAKAPKKAAKPAKKAAKPAKKAARPAKKAAKPKKAKKAARKGGKKKKGGRRR